MLIYSALLRKLNMIAAHNAGRRYFLPVVTFLLLNTIAGGATLTFSLNPTGGYLRTDSRDTQTSPEAINLGALGILPGQTIQLQEAGAFKFCVSDTCFDTGTSLGGVFSSTNTLLSPDNLNRIVGAIQAGPDFVTGPTLFGILPTDIPQDFHISRSGLSIVVPAGASYLTVGVIDSFWGDNLDPNRDFGVVLTFSPQVAAPEPETWVLWSAGLAVFAALRTRCKMRQR